MALGPKGNRDNNRDRTWQEMNGVSRAHRDAADQRGDIKHHNRDVAMRQRVNWDIYQHDQLYDMIWSAEPGTMNQRVQLWHQVAGDIESVTGEVQKTMQALMNDWHGTAAVSAAASNTKLTQWAGDASHAATEIAAGLANYTEAVQSAQHHMPEPAFADAERNFKNGYTVVGTGGPSTAVLLRTLLSDHLASHQDAKDRKADAVRVMRNYETQSRDVHDSLPIFDPATPVVPTSPPEQPRRPVEPPEFVTPPGGDDPTARPSGRNGGDTSTAAASFLDPSLASSGTGYPGGGYPSGGIPSGGAGYGSSGPGGGLRGGPGAGPLAARASGVAAESAGLAGLRGTAGGAGGAGGMYPPMAGAGAQGDKDGEHTNKYDDGLDLFDDLPPAYPPVFGA